MPLKKVNEPKSNEEQAKSPKKMTKAEKKALKAQQAKERQILLKKQQLQKEIDLGVLNTKCHQREWREMVMRVKIPSFREELEVVWHTFDRSLDIKDYSISLLLDALDKAEEQYQMNLRSHMETVDRLLRIYATRLQDHEERYRDNLQELLTISDDEAERINRRQYEDEAFLNSLIFNTKQRREEFLINVQSSVISKIDTREDYNKNVRRIAAADLEKELTTHWHDLRRVINDYENETSARRRSYEIIKAKDDRDRIIIARQVARTADLFGSIREFKDKIAEFKIAADIKITEIRAEHSFFHDAYQTAKHRFLSDQKEDKARLIVLTTEYNLTIRYLRSLVDKANKILILVHECSKYETQDEKILPFSTPIETEEPYKNILSLPDEDRGQRVLNELQDLELFWRRSAAAQIITTELRLERDRLALEARLLNECLRHCLSQNFVQIPGWDESGQI